LPPDVTDLHNKETTTKETQTNVRLSERGHVTDGQLSERL